MILSLHLWEQYILIRYLHVMAIFYFTAGTNKKTHRHKQNIDLLPLYK